MTLHSAASCYPDNPTLSEQQLMASWVDMFQATITCPSCREHFEQALRAYRNMYPSMMNSRKDFVLCTFRIHNSVNRRINKPIYPTVKACFEALKTNVKTRSAREYRQAYLNHIRRFWRTMQDISGITAIKKIAEMSKIEVEYFERRDNNFEKEFEEDNVLLHPRALDAVGSEPPPPIRIDTRTLPRFSLFGGRFSHR